MPAAIAGCQKAGTGGTRGGRSRKQEPTIDIFSMQSLQAEQWYRRGSIGMRAWNSCRCSTSNCATVLQLLLSRQLLCGVLWIGADAMAEELRGAQNDHAIRQTRHTTMQFLMPASLRLRSGYDIRGLLPTGRRAFTVPAEVRGYKRLHSPPAKITT